jgi:hypothetical protein
MGSMKTPRSLARSSDCSGQTALQIQHPAKTNLPTEPTPPATRRRKLKTPELIVAGLPLVLFELGGAIGGGIGGAAAVINVAIFRKDLSPAKRYLYSVLVSLAAAAAYCAIVIGLAMAFPKLFKK